MSKKHYVYLLKSTTSNKTYVGYTIDLKRRLRQHNGEITGGAKKTKHGRPWVMICYLEGFPYETTALQYEWRVHHPPRKRNRHLIFNKIKWMKYVYNLDRYTKTALPCCEFNVNIVWLDDSYIKYWN